VRKFFAPAFLVAAASFGITAPASAIPINLLTNGSFETGDFTGWTQSGNLGFTSVTTGGFGAEAGIYSVYFGPVGSDGILSQTFSDTPGSLLKISGWLAGDGTGFSEFRMLLDGVSGAYVSPVPSQGYTQYTFTALATGLDTFSVQFRNDPSFDGFDNFVITQSASAVPEPSTLALVGAGLAVIGAMRRRRKAKA
jgi:hypothetical protein